jgi:dephospho-CoA kinase
MSEWDYSVFNEKLGNKTQYGILSGRPCSGKTELAKLMAAEMGYQVVDMKAISEDLKAKMNAAREAAGEEPLEGDAPIADVENIVVGKMKDKAAKFLFDGWKYADVKDFLKFVSRFGCPNFVLALKCDDAAVAPRWQAKYNEDAELDDEKKEALKEEGLAADKVNEAFAEEYKELVGRVQHIDIDTSTSLELTKSVLRSNFAPRVILVNHEKRLGVDTTCSNLAIKFGMIYISVYQQIKEHIERDTEWGKKLLLTKRNKGILLTT